MPTLYLLRTGRTIWDDRNRLEPVAASALTAQGVVEVQQAAGQLADKGVRSVYSAGGDAESHTARIAAQTLGARCRIDDRLSDLDVGLWQGLMDQELRQRHAKLYLQWLEDPATVRPPGGESVQEAQERLREAIEWIIGRSRAQGVLVALAPLALAIVRAWLEKAALSDLWRQTKDACAWYSYTPQELAQRMNEQAGEQAS
jgi:broad specificity phosphatase PhoE